MEAGSSPLSDTLRMLRREAETPNFGNQIVVRNLLSSLFVYLMRDWADAISPAANDWFSAVRSPHIARALARMHEAPETCVDTRGTRPGSWFVARCIRS
jgi:hypothetical protein